MFSHFLRGSLFAALLATVLAAQMTNDANGSLAINDVTGGSPLEAVLTPGGALHMVVAGHPNVPYVIGFAPDVAVGSVIYAPGVVLDIGPAENVVVLMNGTESPAVNFWNAFANTGPSGVSQLTFPISPSTPPGLIGALQAFLIDFTLPSLVKATAATRLVVREPLPNLLYSARTTGNGNDTAYLLQPGGTLQTAPGVGPFQFQDIGLRRHGVMATNENAFIVNNSNVEISDGGFYRHVPPTLHAPRFLADDGMAPRLRTVWGDVYMIFDATAGQYGFVRVLDGAAHVLTATMRTPITPGVNPWRRLVAIDGNVMAAVESTVSGFDKIELVLLDGTTWAQTGTAVRDVTPVANVPLVVREESLVLLNDVLYFTGFITSASQPLYRVDVPGTAVATMQTLPPVSLLGPVAVNVVSTDIFVDEVGAMLYMKVANSSGAANAIQRITNIAPNTAAVVTPLTTPTSVPTGLVIVDFGRAHNGKTGRFAVTPNGQKIAFSASTTPAIQEVQIVDTTTNTRTEVTSPARFDAGFAKVMDFLWLDDTRLSFWAGTTESTMDLYVFDTQSSTIVNATKTNGQSGQSLPFLSSVPGAIDTYGEVLLTDRLLFARRGLLTAGSAAGSTSANLCMLDRATLVVQNVTGDEFPGTATTTMAATSPGVTPALAPSGSIVWMCGNRPVTSVVELFSYDIAAPHVAATPHILTSPSTTCRVRSMRMADDGSGCWFIESFQNVNGGSGIFFTSHAGPKTLLVPAFGSTDYFDILPFPANAPHPGFYTIRRASASGFGIPSNQSIAAYDATTAALSILTGTVAPNTTTTFVHLLSVFQP